MILSQVHSEEYAPGRHAVYGIVRGGDDGRSGGVNIPRKLVGVDVHMDTVGVAGCIEPFSGRLDDTTGRLHGRGACDTKAMLAVALDVLEYAKTTGQRPKHDVLIAGTVRVYMSKSATHTHAHTHTHTHTHTQTNTNTHRWTKR
jgi:acetylornithine deacetylase/succinyl-diaminopimelate desuccinylase-like protein